MIVSAILARRVRFIAMQPNDYLHCCDLDSETEGASEAVGDAGAAAVGSVDRPPATLRLKLCKLAEDIPSALTTGSPFGVFGCDIIGSSLVGQSNDQSFGCDFPWDTGSDAGSVFGADAVGGVSAAARALTLRPWKFIVDIPPCIFMCGTSTAFPIFGVIISSPVGLRSGECAWRFPAHDVSEIGRVLRRCRRL